MPILTPVAIASYAYKAGLTDRAQLARATAIAIAESGGNTNAHNKKAPDDSYGLWQINLHGSLKASRMQSLGLSKPEDLFNPATNARAMMAISRNGTQWSAWTTYGGARYTAALLPGQTAAVVAIQTRGAQATLAETVTGVGEDIGDAIGSVTDVATAVGDVATSVREALVWVEKAATWIGDRENWGRIFKVAIGGGLLLVGFQTLLAGTGAEVVGKISSIGKGAKGAVGKVADLGGK